MIDPAILTRARRYCAYQERCQQELRDRLYAWHLHRREVEEVIAAMISEGTLNEQRFATAYAGGKFRIRHWGRVKIRSSLLQKKVSDKCIREALDGIDEQDYRNSLRKVLETYGSRNKRRHPAAEKQRMARYAIGRGFEPALVWETLNERP